MILTNAGNNLNETRVIYLQKIPTNVRILSRATVCMRTCDRSYVIVRTLIRKRDFHSRMQSTRKLKASEIWPWIRESVRSLLKEEKFSRARGTARKTQFQEVT